MFIEIKTTTASIQLAKKIASKLITTKLAACVHIAGPIYSVYFWEDKINEDEEFTLSIKTVISNYDSIEKKILDMHDYDTPQIIFHEIKGYHKYLDWVEKQSK